MADDPNTLVLFLRLILSFGVVLALVCGLTWVLRRRGLLRPGGQVGTPGRLEILDRKSLGKTSSLVVARMGDQTLLLGVTGERIEVLSDAPGLAAPEAARPAGAEAARSATAPASPATAPASHGPISVRHTNPAARAGTHRTGGTRRTGHPKAAPAVDRTRMSFIEALQELTVRRS